MKYNITNLYNSKLFNKIDIYFAEFMHGLDRDDDGDVFLSAALVSRAAGDGDTCLDLNRYAQQVLFTDADTRERLACPSLPVWRENLIASKVVGTPGEFKPLVLDDQNRLYLYRYWEYQKKLADGIRQKAAHKMTVVNRMLLSQGLRRLFEPSSSGIDWHQMAAIAAVLNRFCVISGSPGTGKTHLIAKILVLLLEQDSDLRIFLAAPTGKAAMKLSETIQSVIKNLPLSDAILHAVPKEAVTLHRLLKALPHSPYFHYDSENPLPADVVIVDETSMVDLALLSKLFGALSANARVILVGDMHQLASVEPGSVLGDICDPRYIHAFSEHFCKEVKELIDYSPKDPDVEVLSMRGLHDGIIALQKNYRFSETGGLGGFSRAVKSGNAAKAGAFLSRPDEPAIIWEDVISAEALQEVLERSVIPAYGSYLKTADPSAALNQFNDFQVLCALNHGPFGLHAVNHLIEAILMRKGLIAAAKRSPGPWYRGRPVLITRNDYRLGLYNGDIGIALPDPETQADTLYVFFPGADGKARRFIPYQLPEHETAYAMTVHKSQGSEFAKIMLILPDIDAAVLTRELIYTAVTRAREQVVVCGTRPIWHTAILRKSSRASGLRDALWHGDQSASDSLISDASKDPGPEDPALV